MFGLERLAAWFRSETARPAPPAAEARTFDPELAARRRELLAMAAARPPHARFSKVDAALQEATLAQLAEVKGRR